MNKIIVSDKVIFNTDDKLECLYEEGYINKLKIKVISTTSLEIIYKNIETKLEINIDVEDNKKISIKEIIQNSKLKILNKINLNKNSKLKLIKIVDSCINSRTIINLNGKKSCVNFILKTISTNSDRHDLIINHNNSNTISNVITNGINLNGTLNFNITSYIFKNSFNCKSLLNNRIINFSDKEAFIKPNILTDEIASVKNNTFIGLYTEEENELYKNLAEEEKKKRVIQQFISNNINQQLANKFKKYWR